MRRSRRTVSAAGLIAIVLAAVAPAAGAAARHPVCTSRDRAQPATAHRAAGRAPLVIGDSVLLGAVDDVARAGFEVDARACRALPEAVTLIRRRRRARTLPRLVVVALGANWLIRERELHQALDAAGPDRVLALVTPREPAGASGDDAQVVHRVARRNRGRAVVLDWVRVSAGRRGWFAADGVHLRPAGARAFARLLRRAQRYAVAPPCG